ncbi:MAG: hypothetical protein ACRDCE_22050 [Cetobacterium sp.]|uniref:hypothetical protein n=1 Tax=Cetobacterium sp. TaxID=2071632 RepID=UPI003EE4D999
MGLEMTGTIDLVFESVPATRTTTSEGSYVDGIWVPGVQTTKTYTVNIQPASDQEIQFLNQGAERVRDVRRIYINDGDMQDINDTGTWEFIGLRWKTVKCDNRYWRDYCKVLVDRIDDQ